MKETVGRFLREISWTRRSVVASALAAGLFQASLAEADVGLMRYNSNGTLSTSFDGDGKVVVDIPNSFFETSLGVLVDAGDRVLVTGITSQGGAMQSFALRRTSSGGADTTFNGTGLRIFNVLGTEDSAAPPLFDTDGSILVAGANLGTTSSQSDFWTFIRYSQNGTSVTGIANPVETSSAGTPTGVWGSTLCGSKLWSVGHIRNASGVVVPTVSRFSGNLTMDGTPTLLETGLTGALHSAACEAGTNKVLAAGNGAPTSSTSHFVLTRTLPNGFYDTSFGSGGAVVHDFPSATAEGWAEILVDATISRIYTGGFVSMSGAARIAVGRYHMNGTLDTTFDGDGIAILPVTGSVTMGLAREPVTGKIVVVGHLTPQANEVIEDRTIVARFTTSGALDTTFSADGWDMNTFAPNTESAAADVAFDSLGRIVVIGHI